MRFLQITGSGNMKKIKINPTDNFKKPYIISEVGVNHEGDLDKAKQMIEEVANAGGDAVKFQAYKAETLASKYSPAYWDTEKEKTKSQYELFKKHDTFWKSEFEELADYCKEYNVDFLATPFDIESTDFLEPLMPSYKIASADITNKPFLEYIALKGKPILLSTGASTISEIWRAVEWIKNKGNTQIVLLHCVLNYPTDYKDANLGMINHMKKIFSDFVIGYSDHTLPEYTNDVLTTAWHLGAMVLEKHYTWNKELPGNDHYHAIDYNDLKSFVEKIELNNELLGQFNKNYLESEENSRKYARRSLVAKKSIPKGKIIEKNDITWKRPGTGIPPWMMDHLIGGKALEDIKEDEILKFDKIKFTETV
jgi:sialic acid synthase SpsE